MSPPQQDSGMRRELKVTDAAAFSVGLIGPVGAIALLGTGAAGILGRAATWAFIFALIGVGLVAYAFVGLSRHIAHTGSVYGLVGRTLGPRAGFVAGWALLGAYTAIGTGSTIEIGLFGGEVLKGLGIVDSSDWIVLALVGIAGVALLCFTEIRVITRSLLGAELVGATLVTLLSIVILVRLLTGNAPGDQELSLDFLHLQSGTDVGTIASAAVFGFLAFAGFEGAAALGEETSSPKTDIPKAIIIAVVVVGAFYLLTSATQSLGYGTDAAGVKAFQGAESPFGDLGKLYVGEWLAVILNLMATISLFAISLGTVSGAARILYALARDATGTRNSGLARLTKHGAPGPALVVVLVVILGGIVGQRIAGSAVLDATFYALTLGTISLLVAYVLATLGAIRFLFFGPERRAATWKVIIPALGCVLVLYTLYKNVIGVDAPYDRFPYVIGLWLLIGLGYVALAPGLAGRVRTSLAAEEA